MVNVDRAFDSKDIRDYNRRRDIKSNIPVNPRNTKRKKRGRPRKFDREVYRGRNIVGKSFSWIKDYRKPLPRYERSESSQLGLATLFCIMVLWSVLG